MFDFLLARARVAPPPESRRLFIAGHACGWVAHDVLHWLASFSEVDIRPDGVALLPDMAGVAPADQLACAATELLGRIAAKLYEAGRLNGWRNELLDVLADDGTLLGTIERAAVRPLGIATHAVHLNAWTDSGQLWIARRSANKTTDPGLWDTLVGGLISAAETPELALQRESWEEAGLLPHHLQSGVRSGRFSVQRILPEGYQLEHVTVVDVVLGAEVVPENQDGEVELLRTATVGEVLRLIEEEAFTLEAALSLMASFAARGMAAGAGFAGAAVNP